MKEKSGLKGRWSDAVCMKMLRVAPLLRMFLVCAAVLLPSSPEVSAFAQPAPISNLTVVDAPNDRGTALVLSWQLSPDDKGSKGENKVKGYQIERQAYDESGTLIPAKEGVRHQVTVVPAGASTYEDSNCKHGDGYKYLITVLAADGNKSSLVFNPQPVYPVLQFFDWARLPLFLVLFVLCSSVLLFIALAKSGVPMHVRKIAGLEAIDEAVGRATEMGRPLLLIPGITDMNDIETIAGMIVLSRVAKTAAEYDARLEVPTSKSLVMTAARETTQSAYLEAGRPDAYSEDQIYYVTDDQFGYVAYLTGHMVREKPAACFYFGAFFAESLILAETGNHIGAIQIAGTAEVAQLPFFVAACDYTLIGEEFYAASAYLSGRPEDVGSLRGQDFGKAIVAAGIIIGCVLATGASMLPGSFYQTWLDLLMKFLQPH